MNRSKIKQVNQQIAKLDDGKHVHHLHIGAKFLGKDGELTKDILPDYLHLSKAGYTIWADAVRPQVEETLKK
jgi:lysophospholipase L1-like esterase